LQYTKKINKKKIVSRRFKIGSKRDGLSKKNNNIYMHIRMNNNVNTQLEFC